MTEPQQPDELAAPSNPPARTAGEEDHTDPWALAGEDADPPTDYEPPPVPEELTRVNPQIMSEGDR